MTEMTITEAKAALSPEAFREWKAAQKRAIMERSKANHEAGTAVYLDETFFDDAATHDEDGRPLILTESDLVRVITTGRL